MSITSYSQAYHDGIVAVTATSDLSGLVYYHWYRDGAYVATTTAGNMEFRLEAGDQARIEVFDTNDPDYDPAANTPDEYPARRTLWWLRSLSSDVDHYRVEEFV